MPRALVRLMVGRDPKRPVPALRRRRCATRPCWRSRNFRTATVSGIDLTLRSGEILGIGGLVGQGQEDFLLGLYGATEAAARSWRVGNGAAPSGNVPDANRCGLAYVPADRKKEALLLPHTIASEPDAAELCALRRARAANRGSRRPPDELAAHFAIKGDRRRPVQALSGGNQQKVALAKWMPSDAADPAAQRSDPRRRCRDQARDLPRAARAWRPRARPSCCRAPTRRSWCICATALRCC